MQKLISSWELLPRAARGSWPAVSAGLADYASFGISAAVRSASVAALAQSRASFYGDLNNSSAAARSASVAALAQSRAGFYADLNNSSAAAKSASAGLVDYASLGISKAAVPGVSADLAQRWAPFYAGLDKALKDAGARPLRKGREAVGSNRL